MSELSIQTSILTALRKRGGTWVKLRDSACGVSHFPDIIGCFRGKFVAIEIKIPGEKPRPGQLAFLKLIEQSGGISGWATSTKEALKILEEIE
jgi:hypothetical protein